MNILDFIFPKRCVACGKIGRYFCKKCISHIKYIDKQICPVCSSPAIDGATHPRCKTRYSLDGLTSIFRYDGAVRSAVKSIKYRFVSDLSKEFISLIPSSYYKLITNNPQHTTIIPIPLHRSRLNFRGFNQAEVLGRILSKRFGIPIRTDILKRIRKTIPQVEMKDRKKRLKNMEKVFSVNKLPTINNQPSTVYLFDDVRTSILLGEYVDISIQSTINHQRYIFSTTSTQPVRHSGRQQIFSKDLVPKKFGGLHWHMDKTTVYLTCCRT